MSAGSVAPFEVAAFNSAYTAVAPVDAHAEDRLKSKEELVTEYLKIVRAKPAGQRLVVLRTIFGKQQGSLILRPAKHGITEELMGVYTMSPEEARNAKRVVTAETERKIVDGLPLNLDNQMDNIDIEWILRTDEVCTSNWDAQRTKGALFYVEDLDREINEKVSLRKAKSIASGRIFACSLTEQIDICRLLGIDVREWKPAEIEEFLSERAETEPYRINQIFSDENREARLMMFRLIDKRIVTRFQDAFFFGQKALGANETQLLAFLQDVRNSDIVNAMFVALNPQESRLQPNQDEDYLKRIEAEYARQNPYGGAQNAQVVNNSPVNSIDIEQQAVAYHQGGDDADLPDLSMLDNMPQGKIPDAYQAESPLFNSTPAPLPTPENPKKPGKK